MKIYRLQEKEVKIPAIGDKVRVELEGESQWATCMGYDYIGNPVFLFDNILTELPHDEAVEYCKERGWFLPSKKDLDKWSLMQDARNRISNGKGKLYPFWWWLADGKDKDYFAHVNDDGVINNTDDYYSGGVRPAFILEIVNKKGDI